MKIYIAGRYERAPELRKVRDFLVSYGFEITSRWLDQTEQDSAFGTKELNENPESARIFANKDLSDLHDANVVVAFTDGSGGGRGGYHTEIGYALGAKKAIFLVGPRENIFHAMYRVHRCETIGDLVAELIARRDRYRRAATFMR